MRARWHRDTSMNFSILVVIDHMKLILAVAGPPLPLSVEFGRLETTSDLRFFTPSEREFTALVQSTSTSTTVFSVKLKELVVVLEDVGRDEQGLGPYPDRVY